MTCPHLDDTMAMASAVAMTVIQLARSLPVRVRRRNRGGRSSQMVERPRARKGSGLQSKSLSWWVSCYSGLGTTDTWTCRR